jgi:hypothetical protein
MHYDQGVLSLVWLAGWEADDARTLLKSVGMNESQIYTVMGAFAPASASAALANFQRMLKSDGCQEDFKNILSEIIEKFKTNQLPSTLWDEGCLGIGRHDAW